MDFEIKYSEEKKMILGKLSGDLDLGAIKKMAGEVEKIVEARDCLKFLNDCRESVVPKSIIDIFEVPRLVAEAGLRGNCKCAIVVKDIRDQWEFLETISNNRGQQIRIFTDFDEADAWLNNKEEN
jgi:hypothetical protein